MSRLDVRLFGGLTVEREGRGVPGLDARRTQELLGYLLLHRDRPLPREVLAAQLWAESAAADSLKNLRQTLWQLQACLGERDEPPATRLILAEGDGVRVNLGCDLWLDVAEFERAYAAAHAGLPELLPASAAAAMRAAVDLYRGGLLEGWYQDWCLGERERLHDVYLAMLDRLMAYAEAHAEYEAGLEYGARALGCERACERAHRRVMRLHYLAGDRSAALRQYERCAAALEEDLGVAPSRSTQDLREQIRADCLVPAPGGAPTPPPESEEPPELLGGLRALQASLDGLQRQLAQCIRSMERGIRHTGEKKTRA